MNNSKIDLDALKINLQVSERLWRASDEKLKIVDTHIEKLREEISKIDQLSKKHKDIKCQETLILRCEKDRLEYMKQNCELASKVLKTEKLIETCDKLMQCMLQTEENETN